ncbi:MAG: aldehyde ferredoxin oxidoreductase [Chloroflexi bacterium]|nr:aldehyde ferredoxin oxidoreductase [Chloroflexota bacterium]
MHVLRINTRTREARTEPVPQTWERLGGRGLIARILLDEVPATCEPLGPKNILIWAPGLLVGHMLSSCDRISIGGKSPLTGGVKESNAGGTTGLALARLGIKALLLEDRPEDDRWWVIVIDEQGVRFDPADDLVGLGVYASAERLRERYGTQPAISLIGPAGEMRMRAAGIQNLDRDGMPTRISGRGGLGAVMGSKHIKAIVFDPPKGAKPPLVDPKAFREAQKIYNKALMEHPQTKIYHDYGTAAMTSMTSHFGSLPTRGFSEGYFEGWERLSGEHLREVLIQRGKPSLPNHACMSGCVIQCSNVYADEQGEIITSPLEYETIGLMGSNLGIDDLDVIARLNHEANDLGLDTIEVGAALGVAGRAGLLTWGDGEQALALMDEIRRGTPLGRTLGNGAVVTGQVLGVEQVPAVKGQAMPAYEPRVIKGTGVTYATCPQGADHTAGLTIRAKVDHLNPEGQAELSRKVQISMAGYDTLGVCIFAGFGFAAAPKDIIARLLRARYGWEDVDENILSDLGRETIRLERAFNWRAGFTTADDRLPEWMTREPVPPTGAVFDVPEEDLDTIFDGL